MASKDYLRGAPLLDKLIRREFKDPATALLAFDKGEIDFTYLTADEVERAAQNTNANVIPGPSQVDNAITMNPAKNPAFGNPKFRQAIMHAINRQSIIENLYKGAATPVSCLYGNPAHIPADIDPYEYDPAKPRRPGRGRHRPGRAGRDRDGHLLQRPALARRDDRIPARPGRDRADDQDPADGRANVDQALLRMMASQMSFIGGANGPDPNRAYQYYYSIDQKGNNYKYKNPELDKLLDQCGRDDARQTPCALPAGL
ncbi:MAG: ABC transporter substrate-binding protein [Kouleothrix sp.]